LKWKFDFSLEKGVVIFKKGIVFKKKEMIVFKGIFGLRRNFGMLQIPFLAMKTNYLFVGI
jgi:hypothetical protein